MGVSIANMSVVFSASTAGLVGGLKLGERALNEFKATTANLGVGIHNLVGKVGLLGGAVAAVAGAGSLGALVKSQFDAVDSMGNLSDRMGVSTEALSAMKWAANQADVPFESLTAALDKMLVTLADARNGTGEAALAIKGLGLDVNQLTTLSPDQAFKRISDALAGITDPFTRANAAQAIFGKGAKDVMNLLTEGGGVFDQAALDVQMFGTEITGIDTAKIGMADQAFKTLSEAVSGVAMRFAVELAPYIADVTEKIVAFITSGEGLKSYVVPAIASVATGIGYVVDGWSLAESAVNVVRAAVAGFVAYSLQGIGKVLDGVNYLIEGWNSAADTVGLTSVQVGKIDTQAIYDMGDAFKATASDAIDSATAQADSALSMKGTQAMQEWANSVKATSGQAAAEIAAVNEKMRQQAKVSLPDAKDIKEVKAVAEKKTLGEKLREQHQSPVDEIKKQIADINQAFASGQITGSEADSWIGDLKTKLKDIVNPDKGQAVQARGAFAQTGSAEAAMIADAAYRKSTGKAAKNEKQEKQVQLAKDANALLQKIANAVGTFSKPQIVNF